MFRRDPCESLEKAAANPEAVRHLRLIRGFEDLEAFATVAAKLSNVRKIELGWQSWGVLPEQLAELSELRSFTVLNTPIQTFPEFLAACSHLSELVLRGTSITSIPASVQAFRNLRYLDFSNNPTRTISPEIGKLAELRELQLADLGLKSLPESIAGLRHMRRLALAGNSFSAVQAARVRGWFRRGAVFVWSTDEVAA